MRSIGRVVSIVIAVALSWSMTAPAQAQSKKPVAAKKAPKKKKAQVIHTAAANDEEKGYSYEFRDDPLYGTNGAANAARIHVRKLAPRNTLLRPRLHFIPELLKSVENL